MAAALPATWRAAAAAASVIRLVNYSDEGSVKRIFELGVIQFSNGSLKVLTSVKLDHSQNTSSLSVDIGVSWLDNNPEMVLQNIEPHDTFGFKDQMCRLASPAEGSAAPCQQYPRVIASSGLMCHHVPAWRERLTLRSCQEALIGRPLIRTRKPVPRPLKVGGAGGGPLSLAPLDISTRNRLPKKS